MVYGYILNHDIINQHVSTKWQNSVPNNSNNLLDLRTHNYIFV